MEHTSPLLRLSSDIRRQIYEWVGLADYHPHFFRLNGQKTDFFGLLISCKIIYREASTLLYSSNRFIIRYTTPRSLAPLRALTSRSLASLTSLRVILNEASCHHPEDGNHSYCCHLLRVYPYDGMTYCAHAHGDLHQAPATLLVSSTKDMLAEWTEAATYMSTHINPRALEIQLVCDVEEDDVEAAQLAVAPLKLLSPLANCHVRLCRKTNSRLQQIADAAVKHARGITQTAPDALTQPCLSSSTAPSASHLLNLPQELRLRILEYTDLVTPWNEVTWSRHGRTSRKYTLCRVGCEYGATCPPEVHNGCQFVECWTIGCFCRLQHSAASDSCQCWAAPTDLFLICRTLYLDAQVVFFSQNLFVVHDYDSSAPSDVPDHKELLPCQYPFDRFAASEFLRDVVPKGCLGMLRSLEVVFPPYNWEVWPGEDSPEQRDWLATVGWAKDKLNLPGLALRVVMADVSEWGAPDDRVDMTAEQNRAILQAYDRIIAPLGLWGRRNSSSDKVLARFCASLVEPSKHTYSIEDPSWEEERSREVEDQLKEKAERLVMGDELWEERSGLPEPLRGLWKYAFRRDA
ncbi:hypothetical protein QBC41DRAFT_376237 [Cercophora samala]|uniref:Uncharacterized protein n=1 Tax=Cercophora samala TaxID=330535 RepID=A0AA40D691_9PEZI|nr:hypothetical protein QBC41DRAFT_376237 [Cercophora samala]